jgi:hypothetical protein
MKLPISKGVYMPGKLKRRKLRVVTAGNHHYIQVISGDANALVTYLRGAGLQVGPPGPCDDRSDTIALIGRVDVGAVQTLLNQWG